ncbi:MAG: translation initiation factor IF-2 [Bacteroidetes bacterium]|nr:translation initiation factor IF-2 [Bacteroidota bacterium]
MPENTKEKKLRLYKFAADHNLSTDALIVFLNEKCHEIKSHMTILTDEMIADIQVKYKKDIEKAESHYRKVSEFNKKRSSRAEEAEKAEQEKIVEAAEKVKSKPEPVEEKVDEEVEVPEGEEETEGIPESEEVKEKIQAEEQEIVEESEEVDEKSDQPKSFKTDAEVELGNKKKGLTIIGKIDLSKKKKKPAKKEQVEAVPPKPAAEPAKTETKIIKPASEEGAEKKGKRKRLKVKKKGDAIPDEPVKAKKIKKIKRLEVDKKEVEAAIKRTILSMDETTASDRANVRKKKKKEKLEIQERIAEEKALEKTKIKVTEYIAVNEIANLMDVSVSEVIQKCISLGLMVSINQRLDVDTITLVADEFGFEVEIEEEFISDALEDTPDDPETLKLRPPVVTIMGHVDHGKTSLLDYVRKANVVAGESGGITQHIGAYQVATEGNKYITFLDTPGHEAFTAMRARGARVTDIVILIVAADDAVMPQTVEAINHAQAAGVPIIIAINKIDKPNSNIEKIKQQLADRNILVEGWGGKYQCVEISAKQGTNVSGLLELIALEAEMLELKANPDRNARGTIVETTLEQGRGVTATVLVQKGTLRVGNIFVAGNFHGRVRAMFDERNKKLKHAGPSEPAVVVGFEGTPQAGDTFVVVDTEREARDTASKRQQIKREQDHRQVKLITLDEIAQQIKQGGVKELALIVKGDVDGSVEALADSLMKISNKEVKIRVIHKGVGGISEGDVLLAAASNAIIIGFHVRPNSNARKLAETEKVDIRIYNVIYDAINEVKSALEGMLSPVVSEELVATIEIRNTFKVPKIGTVAGCYVTDGKISRNNKIRLFRDGIVIYEGALATLKRFKDDVKEVDAGYECGLNIANFNDIKIGDIIEGYKIVETKQKLEN